MKTSELKEINTKYLLGRGEITFGLSPRTRILRKYNADLTPHRGLYISAMLFTRGGEELFVFDEFMSEDEIREEANMIEKIVTEITIEQLPKNSRIEKMKILNKEIFGGNGRWRIEHRIFSNKQDLTGLPTEHIVLFGKIRSRKYPEHIEELEFEEFERESSIDTKAKRAKAIVK